ncbi:MAG TPA: hypothetical protein VJZ78_08030 [Anaerolineales bacterium]|nr:hypothetical protein [Anaerolineales bacterium]
MKTYLTNYDEFLDRVETLGFMAFSSFLPGLPSLADETPENLWHTGLDTDPWRWKDRAAEEKRLAYGCILGGQKGFVTQRMYPLFYAAFHPSEPMPDRWKSGLVTKVSWQIWQLFEESGMLNISQVRKHLGVSRGKGSSAADAAIQKLQQEYYITMDGSEQKINAKGEPYGWAVNRYRRVLDWAPEGWLEGVQDWPVEEARNAILDDGVAMSVGIDRKDLSRKLGF